jgi:phosphoglycolate phosphatase
MLQELSQQAYFLAVATGKSRVGLNRAMNAVKLLSLFDATRCADETFSKPHPAMLQELTRELGQDMRRTVMIGDTTHDLLMASNAGAAGIAVSMARIRSNSCRRASRCIRRPRWPSCING